MRIKLGHSPDADDAFMFYALSSGLVDTGGFEFEHVLLDIQSLNEKARRGEFEITAISAAAYPYVRGLYDLTRCGGSFGDNYGPMIVSSRAMTVDELDRVTVAIPGTMTSAYLALRLFRPNLKTLVMPFDKILPAVAAGKVEAGLLIHEGQLTYAGSGLHLVVDLGKWWHDTTGGLPLPLGLNTVRRDLSEQTRQKLSEILLESIRLSLAHREKAVGHALSFSRGLENKLADRFIGMYVNDLTLDMGQRGQRGLEEFFCRGQKAGFIPPATPLRIV
jgi:1,4-dihydroxy-6-naphthoate synthase